MQLSSKHTAKGKLYSLSGNVTTPHMFAIAGATVESNVTLTWTQTDPYWEWWTGKTQENPKF